MEDHELVALCHQGQSQHFAALVKRYQRLIFGLAWHLLRSKEEAEDACQEALLRVYRQIEQRADIDFLPYTKRVLSNLCLDKLRRRQVEQKHLSRDPECEIPDWRTPEQTVMQSTEKQLLREALERLPSMYYEILALYYLAELSYQQIADQLEQPMSIVKNRLFRAKKLLKDAYLELEGGVTACAANK